MLRLDAVQKHVGGVSHLHALDLALISGSINVLLGATLAGKTSLMRIMAGLDRPSSGRILAHERDVTGVSVRKRNLAMVYQQFVNYPSLSVFDNIASPLKLQRKSTAEIKSRVGEIAETLRLTPYLNRLPAELSGGQQQRTALARALAKDAELLMLDEPLVNLDYKLREELRAELAQLFRHRQTTVVYATTEPQEALQLGGHTALLHEGRLLQFGPTLDVFRKPASLDAARTFSDPPMNLLAPHSIDTSIDTNLNPNTHTVGIRPHHLQVAPNHPNDIKITAQVELAEISGSDTYLHATRDRIPLVAQLRGVHEFTIGAPCTLYFNIANAFGFDSQGVLLFAPESV